MCFYVGPIKIESNIADLKKMMDAVRSQQHPRSFFQEIRNFNFEKFYVKHTNSEELTRVMMNLFLYNRYVL